MSNTFIDFLTHYQKRLFHRLHKSSTLYCKLCILFRKRLFCLSTTPVSFVEIFLPLNLYWFPSLGVFFEFFYFCNFQTFSPLFPKKLVLFKHFITAFTRRYQNRCRCGWNILLSRINRKDTRSCSNHSTSYIASLSLLQAPHLYSLSRPSQADLYQSGH